MSTFGRRFLDQLSDFFEERHNSSLYTQFSVYSFVPEECGKEEILSYQRDASKEASLLAIIAKESCPIGLTNPLVEE